MKRLAPLIAITILAFGAACMDRSDADGELSDVGLDVEESSTSQKLEHKDPVDFDEATPARPARTIVQSSSRRGVVPTEPPLAVENFLSLETAERVLSATDLTLQPLAGQPPSPAQNSLRYSPSDEIFGLGLQVFKISEDQSARARHEELREQFLNVSDAGAQKFWSIRGGLQSLVFLSHDEAHLFVLTCDSASCPDRADLLTLASDIASP